MVSLREFVRLIRNIIARSPAANLEYLCSSLHHPSQHTFEKGEKIWAVREKPKHMKHSKQNFDKYLDLSNKVKAPGCD